jgi:DNA-binding response OmpR family regulator
MAKRRVLIVEDEEDAGRSKTRSVDVHTGRLRSKLGPAARQVETVVGLGYRFVD